MLTGVERGAFGWGESVVECGQKTPGLGPERGCCCDKDRKPVPAAGGWGGGAAEAGGPGAGGAPRGAGRAGDCPPVD